MSSLSKSLKALKTDEAKVKTEATDAVGFISTCFVNALPINQFGATSGTGYMFGTTAAASSVTTALDVDSSTTPGAFVQVVESSCLSASGTTHALRSHLPLRAERSR